MSISNGQGKNADTPKTQFEGARDSHEPRMKFERMADGERPVVKKAVNMALRAIGKRNPRAERSGGDSSPAPGGLIKCRSSMGRQGRAQGADEPFGDPASRGVPPRCGGMNDAP